MLVLSRQRDETIMIGDNVEITIVDIRGDKVRLGINAPTSVAVHRKEVYEAIKRENEQASQMRGEELAGLSPQQGHRPTTVSRAATLASRPPGTTAVRSEESLGSTRTVPTKLSPASLPESSARSAH